MKENTKFWSDTSNGGVIIGALAILQSLATVFTKSGWVSFVFIAAYVFALMLLTHRRVRLYSSRENGYSYGKCVKFIFFLSIFAGIISGAYEILASNFFFPDFYAANLETAMSLLSNSGAYNNDQVDMMYSMSKSMMTSPIWVMIIQVLSLVIKGIFFGLILSAFLSRRGNIFASDDNEAKSDEETKK